ncbi:hypothetical protein [Natronobeatus ordinarius]|uniref:hypothetical protein n=1 Tax=Natronobeatus ordinarius TaxID=2963433 RepID=UPI0020CD3151|nr:hypothetical protein [Natronobeatus ordinarius]
MNEVRAIVKGSDEFQDRGSVQWLESGDASSGLEHVLQRHADDFYGNSRLDVSNADDIRDRIYQTIQDGDAHRIPESEGGGTVYINEINEQAVTVIVGDNGYTITSHPGTPANIDT